MNIKVFFPFFYLCSIILVTSIMISCGKENKPTVTKENEKMDDTTKKTSTTSGKGSAGREIFYMKSSENNVACADCHSDGTNRSNPLTKYFSNIEGANKRTST